MVLQGYSGERLPSQSRLQDYQSLSCYVMPRAPMARAELHQTSGAVSSVTYCLHSLNFGGQTKRQRKRQTKLLSVRHGLGLWAMGERASPF